MKKQLITSLMTIGLATAFQLYASTPTGIYDLRSISLFDPPSPHPRLGTSTAGQFRSSIPASGLGTGAAGQLSPSRIRTRDGRWSVRSSIAASGFGTGAAGQFRSSIAASGLGTGAAGRLIFRNCDDVATLALPDYLDYYPVIEPQSAR